MSATGQVVDALAAWFGGTYDPDRRAYTTPQVPGLGLVRRAIPKHLDLADYHADQNEAGNPHGSYLVPFVRRGGDKRLTLPVGAGVKERRSTADLYVFTRSHAEHAEDAQDYVHDLLDALVARIEHDPAVGTGGSEAGGLWVGEGDQRGLTWELTEPHPTKTAIDQLVVITCPILQYVQG